MHWKGCMQIRSVLFSYTYRLTKYIFSYNDTSPASIQDEMKSLKGPSSTSQLNWIFRKPKTTKKKCWSKKRYVLFIARFFSHHSSCTLCCKMFVSIISCGICDLLILRKWHYISVVLHFILLCFTVGRILHIFFYFLFEFKRKIENFYIKFTFFLNSIDRSFK